MGMSSTGGIERVSAATCIFNLRARFVVFVLTRQVHPEQHAAELGVGKALLDLVLNDRLGMPHTSARSQCQKGALIDAGRDPEDAPCTASAPSSTTNSRRLRGSRRSAFEGKPRLFPIEQPTCVAANIAVAGRDQRSVKGDAGETIDIRAIDNDLVILVQR